MVGLSTVLGIRSPRRTSVEIASILNETEASMLSIGRCILDHHVILVHELTIE